MALKRLPVVGQDQGTWGQLLNDNLKQLSDPNKGGINVWTTSTRPTGLTTDDEGRSGVNKDSGKIERWSGAAWEIMGEQIITPYVSSTGTYSAYYGSDQVLNIVGVGTKFTDFKPGDIIVQFDGTNLGSQIEFEKILDDTHAIGVVDRVQTRIKDKQSLGSLNVSGNTYTVPSTAGLAVGDYIDYIGIYYGDIVTSIVDSTHFTGVSPVGFGSQINITAYKFPRAGSNYKIGKTSFSITDVLDGSTKMTVSNFRSKFDSFSTEKFNIDNQILINSDAQVPYNTTIVRVKNNFPSLVQNWTIGNYVETGRNNVLPKYPSSTIETGTMNLITSTLMRTNNGNYSSQATNTLTNAFEVLGLEHYQLGTNRTGVVKQVTGLRIGNSVDLGKNDIYRQIGINVSAEYNYLSGRNGFNSGAPAAQVQVSGMTIVEGGAYGGVAQAAPDGNFDNGGSGWTFNAGWAFENYTDTLGQWTEKWARHTPGSTATLTAALTQTVDTTKLYNVVFTVKNATAGTVSVSLGGVTYTATNNKYNIFAIQPNNTTTLTFTPSSDFNGAIDEVEVWGYNPDSGRNITFGRIGVNTLNPAESIDVKGNIIATGTITPSSDERLKTNITELSSVVDKVSTLKGVTYNWKQPENHGDDTTTQIGLIAQDVEKVFPEAVKTNTETGYKSLNYNGLVGVLVEAVKELKAEIEDLKSQLNK